MLQKPANAMQIRNSNKWNATFPVKVAGTNAITLYDTHASRTYMSLACYTELKKSQPLQNIQALSVHSAMGYDFNPMGFIHCAIVWVMLSLCILLSYVQICKRHLL